MDTTPMGSNPQPSGDGGQSIGPSHQETVNQGEYAVNTGNVSDNQGVPENRRSKGKKLKRGKTTGGQSTSETSSKGAIGTSGESTLEPASKKEKTGPANRTQILQGQTAGTPSPAAFKAGQSEGQQQREPDPNINAGNVVNLLNNGFNVKVETGGMSLTVLQLPEVVDSEGGAQLSLHDDESDPPQGSTSSSTSMSNTALFSGGLGSSVYVVAVRLNDEQIDVEKADITVLTKLKMQQGFSLQDLANSVQDRMDDSAEKNLQGATHAFIFTTVGSVGGTLMAGGSVAAENPEAPAKSNFLSHAGKSLENTGQASGQFLQSVDKSKAELDQSDAQRIQSSMKAIEQAESGTTQSINADNEVVQASLQQILQVLKHLGVNIQ